METLDLVKILAGCPKGTLLYSTIHGDVKFSGINDKEDGYPIRVGFAIGEHIGGASFTSDGLYFGCCSKAECVLFPSKDCRDWSLFKHPQQEFKKGEHVIWHNNDGNEFLCVFVRHTIDRQGVVRFLRGETVSDWDVYTKDLTKVEKFDPKRFKTGDEVLVRDDETCAWTYTLYSHYSDGIFYTSGGADRKCIPYNNETKHLVGTTGDAPEFYNIK
jgi:hypothetical protein